VHEHAASRLHYDLRLEVGGVLESFAVPKGPTLDPAVKHMAVHTEQHPIEYLDFEAVIPGGNYGAGSMIVWDRGVVRFLDPPPDEGLRDGKLDFVLQGYKLRGRFALVRLSGRKGKPATKQDEWLLIKKADAHARPGTVVTEEEPHSVLSGLTVRELANRGEVEAALLAEAERAGGKPRHEDLSRLIPMLCNSGEESELRRKGFLYELKLDGARVLASRDGETASLRYRSGRLASESFPELLRALRLLPAERFVLDGEIVAFDERGRPDFQRLGPRLHAQRANEAARAMRDVPVVLAVFDLLSIGDRDLRSLPLVTRKQLLTSLVRSKGLVRTLDHALDDGRPLFALCEQHDLEGVIAKRANGPYRAGPTRSGDWLKIKRAHDDDFVVVGYTRGKGSRDALGALELATFAGDELVYRGRVGSGLDARTLAILQPKLDALHADAPAFIGDVPATSRGRHFVRPELVVSVRHAGFTHDGHLRHPVLLGLRVDIEPRACVAAPGEQRMQTALVDAARAHQAPRVAPHGRAELTNQDKVYWPDEGYTKGELCAYYDAIADTLLPYLRDRPVLMVRYPDGIAGKNFFQWNAPAHTPSWVRTFSLRSDEHDGREVTALLVDDRDTLLFMANLGCIPLHILASRASDLERCDFLTVDFDLGEAPLRHAIQLARSLRELLDQIGLHGYPKTSGQSGLHVLVALGGVPFVVAKTLGELLGRLLLSRHPELATMERLRKKRPNAVYIDTGQTGRSRAIVAPYSVRAIPGARVSTPLHWDEVGFGLDPSAFTMFTVPERVRAHTDPMAAMLDDAPDIEAAVGVLGTLLRGVPLNSR
jgi:bifunctional non-homologous end joining protein LigD